MYVVFIGRHADPDYPMVYGPFADVNAADDYVSKMLELHGAAVERVSIEKVHDPE